MTHALSKLGMIMKKTNAHKYIKVFYIKNVVLLLQVSIILVAILRDLYYKEWT